MLGFLLLCLIQTGLIAASNVEIRALMPQVTPKTPDLYLCHKIKLDEEKPVYITEFEAKSTKEIAHHILLFACEDASEEETWNCGEMSHKSTEKDFKSGPVCNSRQSIIFAWALDAPKLVLPKDVAFKLGGDTSNKYLVVQVHYANIDYFKDGSTDDSGIILKGQYEPVNKLAGVYLMGTGGYISSGITEKFETACEIRENVEMHPFAYRTHAHKLALVNSGYLVHHDENGKQEWTEIGRRSPQLPQMFYPASNEVVVKKGDILAARCTMHNFRDKTVYIGATGNDEMCNFYIMYWVQGDGLPNDSTCYSGGPPRWHFENFKSKSGKRLNTDLIPASASEVPEAQVEELERMEKSGGMHNMHHSGNGNIDKSDHSNQDHSNHKEKPHKAKNTNLIIEKLVHEYPESKLHFHKRLYSQENSKEGDDLDSFEKAYLIKKLMTQLDLN